jgi:hypothetical protein
MAVIGILGEKRRETKEILRELLERVGQSCEVIDIDESSGSGIMPKVDILVAAEKSEAAMKSIAQAGERSILIMNPDHKDILKCAPKNQGLVITYGFNNKVCVTASSVMDNEMQICIQRDLPTISGKHLEQQEFSVAVDTVERNPEHMLAALAALMVSDADMEKLKVLNL